MTKKTALRLWLDKQEKSQRSLAQRLKISDSFLSELLAGKRSPGFTLGLRIEALTGVTARQMAVRPQPKKKTTDEARTAGA